MKDIMNAIRRYKNVKVQIDNLEKELDELKAVIINGMDGKESLSVKVGGVSLTVTYKPITSTRVDTKKLKELYPQIAAECSTTTTSPRFTIK